MLSLNSKHVQHVKIYLASIFKVNLNTHLEVIALFSSNFKNVNTFHPLFQKLYEIDVKCKQKIYLFILLTMKYFVIEMKQYLWRRQLLILLVYTLWYSILGKPLLIEGCNRHYHWYDSESDRTGCDMVCQDLQNWQYCFIGYVIMCLMPHWSIIFSNMVSPMIHRISLSEIKGKMYKLLAHLTQRVMWAIAITCRPSYVVNFFKNLLLWKY